MLPPLAYWQIQASRDGVVWDRTQTWVEAAAASAPATTEALLHSFLCGSAAMQGLSSSLASECADDGGYEHGDGGEEHHMLSSLRPGGTGRHDDVTLNLSGGRAVVAIAWGRVDEAHLYCC